MTQTRIPLARYLDLLRQHPAGMHAATAAGGQAQRAIARLWDITLQAISQADPAAAGLLGALACDASDSIPRAIIGDPGNDGREDETLGLLASYSMITLTAGTVSMHKLVQAVILAAPGGTGTGGDGPQPRDRALEWLNGALPPDPDTDVAAWPFLRALIPHAEAVASRYAAGQEPPALHRVLNQIAMFHQVQGTYQEALRLRDVCLDIARRLYRDSYNETATSLGNLAVTYSALGRHAEALPLKQRALAVTEAALARITRSPRCAWATWPEVQRAGRHVDALRLDSGRWLSPRPRWSRITWTPRRAWGTWPHLQCPGRHADAPPLEQRALAVTEAALGPDHPDTAVRLGNLARTYSALGRHADALPLEQRALAVTEAALGPDDPRTALRAGQPRGHLQCPGAARRRAAAETAGAGRHRGRAGPGSPGHRALLGNLAATYSELGRHAEALPLKQRALAVTEAALARITRTPRCAWATWPALHSALAARRRAATETSGHDESLRRSKRVPMTGCRSVLGTHLGRGSRQNVAFAVRS